MSELIKIMDGTGKHPLPHVRIGSHWVPLTDLVGTLDALIDHEYQRHGETARHALARLNLEWHRTGTIE